MLTAEQTSGRRERRMRAALARLVRSALAVVGDSATRGQLVRFVTVGASGYAVNLAAFAFAVQEMGIDYRLSAVAAFVLSLTNNFCWHRLWTYGARDGAVAAQSWRFVVVALVGLGVTVLTLQIAVAIGLPKVPSEAIAAIASAPVNFLGQRVWAFQARPKPGASMARSPSRQLS